MTKSKEALDSHSTLMMFENQFKKRTKSIVPEKSVHLPNIKINGGDEKMQ